MSASLEERARGLETEVKKSLTKDSSMYILESSTIFPQTIEVISKQSKEQDIRKCRALLEILHWGLYINQIYQRKLKWMYGKFKNEHPPRKDEYQAYSRDTQSFYDLRKEFLPPHNSKFEKWKTIPSLKERGFLQDGSGNEDLALKLIKVSEEYDYFSITECLSITEERCGERYERLKSFDVYETLITLYSPFSDYCSTDEGKLSPQQFSNVLLRGISCTTEELSASFVASFKRQAENKDFLQGLEERNYLSLLKYFQEIDLEGAGNLDFARRTISALNEMVAIGIRETKQKEFYSPLREHFSELECYSITDAPADFPEKQKRIKW